MTPDERYPCLMTLDKEYLCLMTPDEKYPCLLTPDVKYPILINFLVSFVGKMCGIAFEPVTSAVHVMSTGMTR
jgi:hypothetical protein